MGVVAALKMLLRKPRNVFLNVLDVNFALVAQAKVVTASEQRLAKGSEVFR